MCVKSQRLDVAAICLGKMKHAAGARALRQVRLIGVTSVNEFSLKLGMGGWQI